MAVHYGLWGNRSERQVEAAGLRLAHQELLEQKRVVRNAPSVLVRPHGEKFVAQGQKTARLQSDDRHPARREAGQRGDHAVQLNPRLADKAGGQEGAPAAQWPPTLDRLGQMTSVAARRENFQGIIQVFPLVETVERVGEK